MFTHDMLFEGVVASIAVSQSSLERVVADTIVGVTIAIALFVLYYVLVLRRAGSGQSRDS